MGNGVGCALVLFMMLTAGFPVSTVLSKEGMKVDALKISSPVFENNGQMPEKYTCDGIDVNPPLIIENVPVGTKSLALIVDDPDAPRGTWVHWVVWNIDPKTVEIREHNIPKGALQGMNDFEKRDYGGPCPPSGTHRYFFKLYALDTLLNFSSEAGKAGLEKAMQGHIIGQAQIVGRYKRK
ncbi:MAG TPA: YbhB/YbcL family Raf kinase inhibitor-like protein [Thermodesulfovibrionales bacterium]|nr:YbhB/YbcL family Raf kinase inhibitor-like protein [Thermodesulfovibrionales bacterium]